MSDRVFMGRYETIRLLGEGGMGRVYLARQLDLGRQVVVKVMHDHIAADAKFRERFTRETLLMARFQHPYAVTLFDATLNDPEGPCIVMEYIKGITLEQVLNEMPRLPTQRVGRLLRQMCEALQAAHSQGIVHRDLKPANIMVVDPDTSYEMVKVMDFGLAKLLAPDGFTPHTVSCSEFAVGTPGYMCPEQARGIEMDHRGDIYSLGIILYEMLVGRLPFEDRSTMEILIAHATEEPPTFAFVGASSLVPPAVEQVVRSCLAKEPDQRPATARDLADRFEAALAQSAATPAGGPGAFGAGSPQYPGGQGPLPNLGIRPTAPATPPARKANENASTPSASALTPPDPLATVQYIDAWMPERIASYKLSGFIHDVVGEVVESIPGRIRVRLGGKGCVYVAPSPRSFLGLGRRGAPFDMELRLHRPNAARENQLRITVVIYPGSADLKHDPSWQKLCAQIFCDLRAYLMGQTGPVAAADALG